MLLKATTLPKTLFGGKQMKTIQIIRWDEEPTNNVVVFRTRTEWVKTPEQKREEKRLKEQEAQENA